MNNFTAKELASAKFPLPIRQVTYHGETARFRLPPALHSGDALLMVRFCGGGIQPPPDFYYLKDGVRGRNPLPIVQMLLTRNMEPKGPAATLRIDAHEFDLENSRMLYLHGPILRIEAIKADNMGEILMAISDGQRPTDGRR